MEKVLDEAVYWEGIRGSNTDKNSVTKDMDPFVEILQNLLFIPRRRLLSDRSFSFLYHYPFPFHHEILFPVRVPVENLQFFSLFFRSPAFYRGLPVPSPENCTEKNTSDSGRFFPSLLHFPAFFPFSDRYSCQFKVPLIDKGILALSIKGMLCPAQSGCFC